MFFIYINKIKKNIDVGGVLTERFRIYIYIRFAGSLVWGLLGWHFINNMSIYIYELYLFIYIYVFLFCSIYIYIQWVFLDTHSFSTWDVDGTTNIMLFDVKYCYCCCSCCLTCWFGSVLLAFNISHLNVIILKRFGQFERQTPTIRRNTCGLDFTATQA